MEHMDKVEEKCGICDMEVKEKPKVQSDATCSHCGKKLQMTK